MVDRDRDREEEMVLVDEEDGEEGDDVTLNLPGIFPLLLLVTTTSEDTGVTTPGLT